MADSQLPVPRPSYCLCKRPLPSHTPSATVLLQATAARASDAAVLAPSPAAFVLPALATGLQVPRALLLRSHMWFTGKPFADPQAAALHGAWEVPQPPCWQNGQPGQQMNGGCQQC